MLELTADGFAGGPRVGRNKAIASTERIVRNQRPASFGRSWDDNAIIARGLFSIRSISATDTSLENNNHSL